MDTSKQRARWRCRGCGHLLGVIDGDRLEIRVGRGHQYRVALPVTCVCKNPQCRCLNELWPPPPEPSSAATSGGRR